MNTLYLLNARPTFKTIEWSAALRYSLSGKRCGLGMVDIKLINREECFYGRIYRRVFRGILDVESRERKCTSAEQAWADTTAPPAASPAP